VQITLLAQGDHLFDERTDRLGLGHGRLHAVFFDNGRDQVSQERAAMAGVASEFESCIAMAHNKNSLSVNSDQGTVVSDRKSGITARDQ
jgi:hypothetical protein